MRRFLLFGLFVLLAVTAAGCPVFTRGDRPGVSRAAPPAAAPAEPSE